MQQKRNKNSIIHFLTPVCFIQNKRIAHKENTANSQARLIIVLLVGQKLKGIEMSVKLNSCERDQLFLIATHIVQSLKKSVHHRLTPTRITILTQG